MILAAGRGERLKPLTDHTPKPLIAIDGLSLIELHLLRLRQCGILNVVINLAHLGKQIQEKLGDGEQYGININYSHEQQALETAGGIAKALPLINSDPFIVINADIICDFDLDLLIKSELSEAKLATLVMVPNPPQHSAGDFHYHQYQLNSSAVSGSKTLTFSGIALYRKACFSDLAVEKAPLARLLKSLIKNRQTNAIKATGLWHDIGTVERLSDARNNETIQEYITSLRRAHKSSET